MPVSGPGIGPGSKTAPCLSGTGTGQELQFVRDLINAQSGIQARQLQRVEGKRAPASDLPQQEEVLFAVYVQRNDDATHQECSQIGDKPVSAAGGPDKQAVAFLKLLFL